MVDTDPTFPADIGISQSVISSPEPSRHSRIHFPADELGQPSPENPHQSPLFSLRSSPVRQGSPLRPSNAKDSPNARRRVRSIHAASTLVESPRPNRVPAISLVSPVRRVTTPKQDIPSESNVEDFGHGVFSDEYDLCELFLDL
jgi:hypothetical protein